MFFLILFFGVSFFVDGGISVDDLFFCRRYVDVFKYFDLNLLFFGFGDLFLKFC